jgi:predicted XRE-type DNA-binding protein
MPSKTKVTRGSGNVFADLGLPDAETHQLKAQLVMRIADVIQSRKLTQTDAAGLIGASQPDVSRMLRGHFRDISSERLMHFLRRLGCDVDIVVKPANKRAYAPIHLEAENA